MSTRTLSVSQALVEFLANQWTVDRIGGEEYRERTIPGMFGIFGHGNVAGVGQALKQYQAQDPALMPYYQGRNEQAQVHQAVGYARHTRRRATFAVSTSIGPGATNMVTGAALATANRLPALLFPSDQFASRTPDPVLQQLERPDAGDITVNDVFRPVSRFFDRVVRPEQLFSALLSGMRVLTDPAETGAVTIALPQDVQAEAIEVPEEFLAPREWRIRRPARRRRTSAPPSRRFVRPSDRWSSPEAACTTPSRRSSSGSSPRRPGSPWPTPRPVWACSTGTTRCAWAPSGRPGPRRPTPWSPTPTS
jgi:3D-(3,5/4)-trihydroxycyclohexane-1,2-dione acylhydrolase (decyclizing)